MQLDVVDLHKSYGSNPALAGVSFSVAPGDIVALLGRNGAGKSTLVGAVAGVVTPDAGSVLGDGVLLADHRNLRARIGYAPQETGLYDLLTGVENLRFHAELAGVSRRRFRARLGLVTDAFGLAPLLTRRVDQLSGGERRRLHAAAALIHEPEILLLDEPTVGVDVESRIAILQAVKDLAGSGVGIVYTTHYLPEIEALGARIVIIDRGRVLAEGDQADLLDAFGTSGVVLRFAGPAPRPRRPHPRFVVDGDTLSIHGARAAVLAGRVLAGLGADADRLVSVETVTPTLESVFLSLTGEPAEDPQ